MKTKLEYEMVGEGECRVNVVGNDGMWVLFYADSTEWICSDCSDWSEENLDRAQALARRAFESASKETEEEEAADNE